MLAAIPAIAVALFLVIEGGLVFALGLFVLGVVGMHELYAMYERAHPARLAGFIALAGLLRRRSTAASSRSCSSPWRRCRWCSR